MGKLYYQDKAGDIKVTSKGIPSPTDETAVAEALNEQSETLFKTINGQTITGEGNIEVGGGGSSCQISDLAIELDPIYGNGDIWGNDWELADFTDCNELGALLYNNYNGAYCVFSYYNVLSDTWVPTICTIQVLSYVSAGCHFTITNSLNEIADINIYVDADTGELKLSGMCSVHYNMYIDLTYNAPQLYYNGEWDTIIKAMNDAENDEFWCEDTTVTIFNYSLENSITEKGETQFQYDWDNNVMVVYQYTSKGSIAFYAQWDEAEQEYGYEQYWNTFLPPAEGNMYDLDTTPDYDFIINYNEETQLEDWPQQFSYKVTVSDLNYQKNQPLNGSKYNALRESINTIVQYKPTKLHIVDSIRMYNADTHEWATYSWLTETIWTLTNQYHEEDAPHTEDTLTYSTTILPGFTVYLIIRKIVTEQEDPNPPIENYWFLFQTPEIKMYGAPVLCEVYHHEEE